MRTFWTVVAVLLAALTGFAAGKDFVSPPCPSEDSCTIDYNGDTDRFVITQVTP